MDEAHQILATAPKILHRKWSQRHIDAKPRYCDLWQDFQCDFRWYVTGTPLPYGRVSLIGLAWFLGIETDKFSENILKIEVDQRFIPIEHLLFTTIKSCLFWRNTKESVKDQIKIPPVNEQIYFVEFTPVEKVLYDATKFRTGSYSKLRLFCAINDSFLESIYLRKINDVNKAINYNRGYLRDAYVRLAGYEIMHVQNLRAMEQTGTPHVANPAYNSLGYQTLKSKERLDETIRAIQNYKKSIIQDLAELSILSTILDENEAHCVLCNKIVYFVEETPCAHSFCTQCIHKHLETAQTCPTCAAELQKEDLKSVLLTVAEYNSVRDKAGGLYRSRYGSKFAAIGGYLQSIMHSTDNVKIIVFSQYEETLTDLTSIMCAADEVSFNNQIVYCKGNIFQRRKALNAFNSTEPGSPRILLLSLAHSASGTHLPIATHIILVDPVVGSEENAKTLDSQAIARAHRIGQDQTVTAVRFIVKGSIEQDDYEGAYGVIRSAEINQFSFSEKKREKEPDTAVIPSDSEPEEDDEEFDEKPKRKSKSPVKKRTGKSPTKRSVSPKKTTKPKEPSDSEPEEDDEEFDEKPKRKSKSPAKKRTGKSPAKRSASPKKPIQEQSKGKGSVEPTEKPKRGRPKKSVVEEEEKKKRGRPAKKESEEEDEEEDEEEVSKLKKRGRPAKRTVGKSPPKKKQKENEKTTIATRTSSRKKTATKAYIEEC